MHISWSDNSVQQSAFKTENNLRGDDPYVPIAAENFQEMEGGECLLMSRLDTQINRKIALIEQKNVDSINLYCKYV